MVRSGSTALFCASGPLFCSLSLCISSGLVGCKGEAQAAPVAKPPKVTVTTPARMDVNTYEEFTGYTEASESVEIRARVRGFLQEVHFEPSTIVEVGEDLFDIDPAPYQAVLDRRKADLMIAEAELDKMNWALNRVKEMVAQEAANPQEVQDALADVALAEGKIEAAKAEITAAELDLGYCKVVSPLQGRVGRTMVDKGNLVGGGEATLLTTVADMSPTYAYFNVGEEVVLPLLEELSKREDKNEKRQTKVYLGLLNSTDFPLEGIIDYIDITVDPETGTVPLRAVFPNENWDLYPGLFARIRLPGEIISNAVLVRNEAIGTDLGGKYVYVVDDNNIVKHTRVTLGPLLDNEWRVIQEGMEGSERYIAVGLMRARPEMPVEPESVDVTSFPALPVLTNLQAGQPSALSAPADEGTAENDQ